MKKVLFLITNLGGGGAERVLVNLANMLDRTKYDVTVQTLFDVGVNRSSLQKEVHYKPGFKWYFPGNSHILAMFPRRFLYHMLIREEYDIVVSFLEGPSARIVSGCTNQATKLVTWIHVEQNNQKTAAQGFRSFKEAETVYNRFDKVVCVSETVKADFCSLFQLKAEPIVLYNVNDTEKIQKLAAESLESGALSENTNVISVGRMIAQKGFDRLINVHAKLLREGIQHHLYLLGTGADLETLKEQAAALKVQETVHFLGFQDNPYKYISRADLFVCSSRREGFSTAVTESLVLGVPAVSTNCSGAVELLGEKNEYGIVTTNDEDGIYSGMKKILTSPELLLHYKKMAGLRGSKFASDKVVDAVGKMLDNL